MLIVYGGVRVLEERVTEVDEAARVFEQKCREEDGCVEYVLSWRVDDATRIQLLEAWETREAWETHKTQPHVVEWAAYVGSVAAGPPAFTHHETPA
ncbi:MAG: antibiotic biosynthesis monooxygenase [Gaiellales bacterium]